MAVAVFGHFTENQFLDTKFKSSLSSNTNVSSKMGKIQAGDVVEMNGDEMTRVIWELIKVRRILTYLKMR